MNESERIGIIDIGSNSIRLVLYELLDGDAYRIIDESKESARLSDRIREDGTLGIEDIRYLADVLLHFKRLCAANRIGRIRAVATAAIRNAANRRDIVAALRAWTGLDIEVLSGEEEARIGFLGMINTTDIADGFLIDIGGGSTEISLFRNRKLLHSVSFPFGCVNTAKRYAAGNGPVRPEQLEEIRKMVDEALRKHPWCASNRGLPLIGLGGTVRTLCKIDQARRRYSLPLTHQYELQPSQVRGWIDTLAPLSAEKRKKFDGVSDDRADLIVPGFAILHAILQHLGSTVLVVSGAGLRDGLFYETINPKRPLVDNVLQRSVHTLLKLYPTVSVRHTDQVNKLALKLFDGVFGKEGDPRLRSCVDAASRLYRIGIAISYYDYPKHTFYMLAHSRLNGMSHREVLMTALIASYKTRGRAKKLQQAHRDILQDQDLGVISRLGTLVRLAVALDRSGTQPVSEIEVTRTPDQLQVHLYSTHDTSVELREVRSLRSEIKKVWGFKLVLRETRDKQQKPGKKRKRSAE
ncbi:Ppx/GppA family phosphatase [Paenibacillus thermoaerophilus]|uniref:Ppx/GppA family phosphatase n=1 Tax=Paenibacillus thermoaerophilus TaxID=1215385 RepID=A0ABW2UYY8_9BACL|nr:Ppx/GppA phosphatase family protein [Paenibacillus thermoaerophilus]TMV16006.1 Ppx/GppA family phosphatase [Paenibacillus thermoaerophilus]